jgi:hypothetical protein
MRRIAYIAFLLPALAVAAPTYHSTLSGDQFVAMVSMQHEDAFGYRERDRAYAYVDGVQDAAAGKAWCAPQPVKTDELAYAAADYIKRLPAEQRKASAAPLLIAYLSSLHPCSTKKR